MDKHFTRRRFLHRALATTAACGLARISNADDRRSTSTAAVPIIDTHIYLNRWPHARLPGDEPTDLLAILRTNHVSQAWAGAFDGLFHKDITAVNQRLAEACHQYGNGSLIPFGTVNPTLPDWEEDLRRCHETFHMPGIRLHPNYHGYTLDDPRFVRLLELAAGRGLNVQLVAWLDDARHKWLSPAAAQVDLKPLAKVVAKLPSLRLVIAGGVRNADDEAASSLAPLKHAYFDFARLNDADQLEKLVDRVSAKRIVFGSGAPLHPVESGRSILIAAKLSNDQRNSITSGTATPLIGERPRTGATQ